MIEFKRISRPWYPDESDGTEIRIQRKLPEQVSIKIPSDEIGLGELLETFERFLLACGFCFDGHVEIVAPEDSEEEDPYLKRARQWEEMGTAEEAPPHAEDR